MSSFRKRHSVSGMKVNHDDGSSVKDNALLGYSDDEDGAMTPAKDHRSVASVKTDATIPSDIAANFLSEGATRFSDGESDEMEEDLNIFNKTVQISDLDKAAGVTLQNLTSNDGFVVKTNSTTCGNKSPSVSKFIMVGTIFFLRRVFIEDSSLINHATLLRKMHERFKRKADKWERLAYSFARYGFVMNFAILVLQLLQMILHQAASTWTLGSKDMPRESDKSLLQSIGWKKQPGNQTGLTWTDFLEAALSRQCLQTAHGLITASTALIAGLQLKLKLSEKAERYRKGAKVYGRLLRVSSYYLMMVESGGKVDDVTGLWREAMKKEGKWIPLVKSYVPL